jgi:hypothetical protein
LSWLVAAHPEFEKWLLALDREERNELLANIEVLEEIGPNLSRPRVDTVKGSKFKNMKELRIQHKGNPWRILFAFDPKRTAVLLVGGNKGGDERWYKKNIPIADTRFKEHLEELETE